MSIPPRQTTFRSDTAGPSPVSFSPWFDELAVDMEMKTRGRTITESDVVAFAAQTGDWHAQHSDVEFARRSLFGGRIAHGLLVLSYALGLMPIDSARVVALRRISDATFKAPVHLGDTISVHVTIAKLRPMPRGLGIVEFHWRVINQRDETVVRADVEVLWRREPPAV